jgi:hypothetical protein
MSGVTRLYSRGVIDRDAKNPREDLRRLKSSLHTKRLIGERDGLVWDAHQPYDAIARLLELTIRRELARKPLSAHHSFGGR